jgi:hypothetical protein
MNLPATIDDAAISANLRRYAEVISRPVASSTNAGSVHTAPRSSNQACSEPSICTNSPTQSRRRRG